MCISDRQQQGGTSTTRNVIISGAGPAGLLLSSLLLKHNKESTNGIKYNVTLIESRLAIGELDVKTELPKYRSWMIGLAGHGLNALRTIPELYNEYVQQDHVGVKINSFSIYLGSYKMENKIDEADAQKAKAENPDNEAYIVDRNFVVAAMARFLKDQHSNDPHYEERYETKLMYVDSENHRVLVRKNDDNKEEYLDYDLLVGADGARSIVRESLMKENYDFEMDFGDIFNNFKAVHVQRPETLNHDGMSILPACLPKMTGICLPMPGGELVNISIGCTRNAFDELAPELKSEDVKVVADYMRKNFKAFELVDYEDFAQKWINNGRWNRTAQVHCNMYHSLGAKAVIMGDAAHATSPSIGMGMNTALRDAQAFYQLLQEHDDDLDKVLVEFSKKRVKEGNSLTDLAFNLYCLDEGAQGKETLHMLVRGKLSDWFPSVFTKHPQMIIGSPKYNLADVYQIATQLNIIPKHRAINDQIRRKYYEESIGMLPKASAASSTGILVLLGLSALSVAGMVAGMKFYAATP